MITNSIFRHVNFAEVFLFMKKMCHNWWNNSKKLKFSDAKNTRKIDAFFSKWKSSETQELEIDEQSENSPSSSDMVIDFVEQNESRPSASTSSTESQFSHVSEPEAWFKLCILTLCLKIRSRLAKYPTTNFSLYWCIFPQLGGPRSLPLPIKNKALVMEKMLWKSFFFCHH